MGESVAMGSFPAPPKIKAPKKTATEIIAEAVAEDNA